jgi:hypothetical protein
VLVGIHWTTANGARSSLMGVGPLGTMPEHRRAPYFALIGWGGEHRNEHWEFKGGVSLVSSPLLPKFAKKATHARAREESEARTAAMRKLPFGQAAHHRVAFCVPERHREQIEAAAAACKARA